MDPVDSGAIEERKLDLRPIAGGAPEGDGGGDAADAGDGSGGDPDFDNPPAAGGGEEEKEGGDTKAAIDALSERMDKFMEQAQGDEEDPLDDFDLFDEFGDDDDEYDDDFDEGGDQGGNPDDPDALARSADAIVEQLVDQKVQERLAPHLQQQYEERRHEQVVALENKYPELGEQEKAVPLLREAAKLAKSLGEPELAREAPFLETVHLRMKAEAARAEETSGGKGEDEAPVEGAGGSNESSGESAEDAVRKLVSDASSRGKSIFG